MQLNHSSYFAKFKDDIMQPQEQKIAITVENLAPENGGSLAPFWFGFHNGQFDSFNEGESASPAIEALAEDGNTEPISQQFDDTNFGEVQGTLRGSLGGDFAPGQVIETEVVLDGNSALSQYFSYASMILPSNDQFIANDNARDHLIFDDNGRFLGAEFTVNALEAWDSGTEVNDEIPENTAFFGQTTPNTGVDENGVVTQAPGFLPPGSGGILDDPRFANADFTAPGYQIASVRIANLIEGTDRSEVLFGTAAPDDIDAQDGDNIVFGQKGNDRIFAGTGEDYLRGGRGDDLIDAGDGNNIVYGNRGDDLINTGNGDDLIFAGIGNDIVNAGIGSDIVFLGRGSDRLFLNAGEGSVEVYSFNRNNTISLGEGLSADSPLTVEILGSDTQIYSGEDLLATLNGIQLDDLTIV
jgi:Ca2+-binding RTX toxin-like protein